MKKKNQSSNSNQNFEVDNEFKCIADALKQASENGLELEFIWSALHSARQGNCVTSACIHALYEWDL